MKVTELQLHSKLQQSRPSLNMPNVGNGSRFRGSKRLSPPVALCGGLRRFQPRILLHFPTWGIFRDGIDSCDLKCSCNSVMHIKFSYYLYEREFRCLVIVNKLCAFISNL